MLRGINLHFSIINFAPLGITLVGKVRDIAQHMHGSEVPLTRSRFVHTLGQALRLRARAPDKLASPQYVVDPAALATVPRLLAAARVSHLLESGRRVHARWPTAPGATRIPRRRTRADSEHSLFGVLLR